MVSLTIASPQPHPPKGFRNRNSFHVRHTPKTIPIADTDETSARSALSTNNRLPPAKPASDQREFAQARILLSLEYLGVGSFNMKVASKTQRVIRCTIAVSALPATACFAGATDAVAVSAKQVDATTSSITVDFDLDAGQLDPKMEAVAVKWSADGKWEELSPSSIGSLTSEGATIIGLRPGTKASCMRFDYSYSAPGSCVRFSKSLFLPDPITVAKRTGGLRIVDQLATTQKLKLAFDVPQALSGYEVKLKPIDSSKTVKIKYDFGTALAPGQETWRTLYTSASLNTAYVAKVRTFATMDDAATSRVYSAWSEPTLLVPQPKVTGKRNGNSSDLEWNKIAGAKNYTVYASDRTSGGFEKVATTKSNKYTITKVHGKKMKKGKPYYYYVKAAVKHDGRNYTSPFLSIYG